MNGEKEVAGRHGERAARLHLLVVAPEELNGIDSHDHLVSRIKARELKL